MRSLLLTTLLLVPACLTEVDTDSTDLGEATSDIVIPAPTTTLTLYESANFTGRTYSTHLASPDANERIALIAEPDIQAAGLLGKVSAVRLACGSRAARVVLFDAYNTSNTSFSDWSHLGGTGATIECAPGHTTSVNLHVTRPALADRVASAFLVTHAASVDHVNYSDFAESVWATALDRLPSAATATGTDIWLSTTRRFEIHQYLTLDSLVCTKRGAEFEYSVLMHDDETFSTTVVESYVDYGFGDAWGCHDEMKSTLDAALAAGIPDLDDGFDELAHFLAPNHARYYFVPDAGLGAFNLFFGADPIVNAPP